MRKAWLFTQLSSKRFFRRKIGDELPCIRSLVYLIRLCIFLEIVGRYTVCIYNTT